MAVTNVPHMLVRLTQGKVTDNNFDHGNRVPFESVTPLPSLAQSPRVLTPLAPLGEHNDLCRFAENGRGVLSSMDWYNLSELELATAYIRHGMQPDEFMLRGGATVHETVGGGGSCGA